uniref:Laminin EGF-like domain-containing protein n=1 Tax=Panagrolaimus sp. ES5 TaxID=591445 RepID=A0AC34FQI4_9BILA
MNGVEICECPEHFTGNSCEKCEDGFRRVHNQLYGGRCEKCNCEGHSGECDPFTGSCLNCKHNTTGPRCEQCRQGFYGNPLLGGELGA